MREETLEQLDFGDPERTTASLSESIRGLVGSEILKIAAEIREMAASGRKICNLTVGDFDSRYFPIPRQLASGIEQALENGETNYPPSDGMLQLRAAVTRFVLREWGANYPVESVLISSGARPILYAVYRAVLDPGDKVVYPVPSWNNNHYAWVCGATGVALPTSAEHGFMPTVEQLRPHLGDARLLTINSPLNPTGTMISREQLTELLEAIVAENRARDRTGRPHLLLLHDQIYATLVFGSARHWMPTTLVPACAPYVISLDGISKGFAATGLRVGWMLAPPALTAKVKSLIGHIGAWAPRPEQVALARFLDDLPAVAAYRKEMDRQVQCRLDALYNAFSEMQREGYPVECINPQGAIYLSLRLDLIGRDVDGLRIETNEQIRRLLLDRAGLGAVPFQAFGLEEESGWFRLSVGAVSLEDIEGMLPRVRRFLDQVNP